MKKCPQCGKEYQDANTLCPADGTVLEKETDDLIGQTLASKYRVEELINKGGMGAVYRGTHVLMDKTVAIKVLHPALAADDTIVARFSREARAASRISHPHALNVTDFGEDEGGIVFLVMEYLRGKTLKEVIHEDGPLPLPRAVEIIRQICGALETAHAEGVVHRDLKSDNIMLVEVSGGGDWAKVLDFGIAKITEKVGQDPALTAPNLIIGTPQYMSPEQCSQAAELDARSDIYSLGIILYEMLAGHVPFTGESPTAIMMQHLQDAPPSILEERKDLPVEVDHVITRALAKLPADRFQTVSELSDSLALTAVGYETATDPVASARDTDRIGFPTDSNESPRQTISEEEDDEATIVRPKTVPVVREPVVSRGVIAPLPPPPNVNVWKIIIPAVAGLVVLFGVIYALTGRNAAQTPANTNNLTVDPGGQPVQAASPVTGKGEQGISPNAPVNNASGNTTPLTQTETPPSSNGAEPVTNENVNDNSNANQSRNSNSAGEEPTPPPVKNTNGRGELPPSQNSPTPANNAGDDPPPLPSPTQSKPKPKPTPPPTGTAPQTPPPGAGDPPR